MGGRRIAGTGQLLLALIGFVLLLGWSADTSISQRSRARYLDADKSYAWLAMGFARVRGRLVWSLITSISLAPGQTEEPKVSVLI